MKDTKGRVQPSNDTILSNTWFSRVKTAEEENSEEVDFVGLRRQVTREFDWLNWKN